MLAAANHIAVVGLSPKEARPSNQVARYLVARGFVVIPINPGQDQILGLPCFPDLTTAVNELGVGIDLVNIFRRAELVGPIVREAIAIGAGGIWMQEGVVNPEAAGEAEAAGLEVIMDQCLKTIHQQLWPPTRCNKQ
ncbi:CoA-binding domain protein [Desulfurivibrio alkaliphilus AHT 2]|uniref:CoA-binding domain protein n=2 Tax=Desulfurivibrio alkaliphilus TaxID=427923 RepID=D6Z5H2_DESAT|nr:CoA-binding domain protein [Desulfurivibrio alkaliphilus AHT 2]